MEVSYNAPFTADVDKADEIPVREIRADALATVRRGPSRKKGSFLLLEQAGRASSLLFIHAFTLIN